MTAAATPEELGDALTKAGAARLDAALKQLRFDRPCDAYFRVELVTAIRKFAVMTGDLELEAGCDARLSGLAEAPNYCHPPENWVNHPSGRSEPWCAKCEASPTRSVRNA